VGQTSPPDHEFFRDFKDSPIIVQLLLSIGHFGVCS
jgi:hypothetical protein